MLTYEARKFEGALLDLFPSSGPRVRPDRGAGVPDPGAPWPDGGASGSPPIQQGPNDDPHRQRRMDMAADTRQRTDHMGTRRFSEGVEKLPDIPEKRLTGRFSCGVERWPNTPEKTMTRRFSHGIEQLPEVPEKRAFGRFSGGIERMPSGHDRTPGSAT